MSDGVFDKQGLWWPCISLQSTIKTLTCFADLKEMGFDIKGKSIIGCILDAAIFVNINLTDYTVVNLILKEIYQDTSLTCHGSFALTPERYKELCDGYHIATSGKDVLQMLSEYDNSGHDTNYCAVMKENLAVL
jgi:hypothetical protein